MFSSNSIWAAYGIRTAPDETFELQNLNHLAQRAAAADPILILDIATAPTPYTALPATEPTPTTSPTHPTTTSDPAIPIAPSASPASHPPSRISSAAIAGLSLSIAILVALAAYIILELFVLRRRRKERALMRAVAEVESGSIRSDSVSSEVKSREGGEKEICDGEGVWGIEEGRKGMSLQRRMW